MNTLTDQQARQQRFFFLLLAAYFTFHWLLRTVSGGGFELDEAEQLVLGQRLQLGYNPNPPLYTWLQIPLLRLFGEHVLPLSLMKNLLLFGTYSAVYFIGRRCGFGVEKAFLASLSLLLLPGIGWESQRDLTHSVLVTTVAAATLLVILDLLQGRRETVRYLLLGLLFGLGVLSKWNFGLLALALVVTLASMQPRTVFRPAILLSLLVAALLVAPYLWWVYEHLSVATATSYKLVVETSPYLERLAKGVKTLAGAYLEYAALFLVLVTAFFLPWRAERKDSESEKPLAVNYLIRLFWVSLGMLMLFMLVSGGTVFRSRWLLPLLFYLPVLVFALIPGTFWVPRRIRSYRRLLYAVIILIPIGLMARVYLLPHFGDFTKPHFPGEELAQALKREAGEQDLLIAADNFIGGNLQPYLMNTLVAAPPVDFPLGAARRHPDESFLLLWNSAQHREAPGALRAYAAERLGRSIEPVGPSREMQVLYRFSETEHYKLGWQKYRAVPPNG